MLLPASGAGATTAQRGTLAYQPPELLASDAVSFATDCYAFGVLLWEMLTAQACPLANVHIYSCLSMEMLIVQARP